MIRERARSRRNPAALRRVIPSRLKAVDALCLELRGLLRDSGLAAESFAVELLARESLNNAVIHGNRRNPAKRVACELRIGRVWIRLAVADQGPGFDWAAMRRARREDSAESGRGLPIYALYAARTRFNRRGNRITFWIPKHAKEN